MAYEYVRDWAARKLDAGLSAYAGAHPLDNVPPINIVTSTAKVSGAGTLIDSTVHGEVVLEEGAVMKGCVVDKDSTVHLFPGAVLQETRITRSTLVMGAGSQGLLLNLIDSTLSLGAGSKAVYVDVDQAGCGPCSVCFGAGALLLHVILKIGDRAVYGRDATLCCVMHTVQNVLQTGDRFVASVPVPHLNVADICGELEHAVVEDRRNQALWPVKLTSQNCMLCGDSFRVLCGCSLSTKDMQIGNNVTVSCSQPQSRTCGLGLASETLRMKNGSSILGAGRGFSCDSGLSRCYAKGTRLECGRVTTVVLRSSLTNLNLSDMCIGVPDNKWYVI